MSPRVIAFILNCMKPSHFDWRHSKMDGQTYIKHEHCIILNVSYKMRITGLTSSSFLPQSILSWKTSMFETIHIFCFDMHYCLVLYSLNLMLSLDYESNFIHEKQNTVTLCIHHQHKFLHFFLTMMIKLSLLLHT